jgi:hypothetical protein
MSLVTKSDMPNNPEWAKRLRQQLKLLLNSNGKTNVIRVDLKREEKSAGLESAWRKICKNELKKKPHVKIYKHELGTTVWLSWE